MKKIISFVLVILCMVSLVACGDKDSANVFKKLSPTGERVDVSSVESFVENRENTYLESDIEKFKNTSTQWFEVNVKYLQKSESENQSRVSKNKSLLEVKGVIGISLNGDLEMDVEIVYEEEIFRKYSDEKETENENKLNARIIACDGYVYIDAKVTESENGERATEKIKVMSPVGELGLGIDFDEITTDVLYGEGVYDLLEILIDVDDDMDKVDYYLDAEKVFMELDMDEDYGDDEYQKGVIQFEVKYANQSAFVEAVRCYGDVKYHGESLNYFSESELKIGFSIAQCEAKTITAPDTKGYEQA
ncbi:MAG: hypothetical protein IJA76_00510 [Clostridia bacterium]|nr:hypothetical protein [Clostridia bacterium]MBQ6882720.1 hypothetical protein [Clostridia bacterium]